MRDARRSLWLAAALAACGGGAPADDGLPGHAPVVGPDGLYVDCEILHEGRCFVSAREACAFAGCPPERCLTLDSYPGQLECGAEAPPEPAPASARDQQQIGGVVWTLEVDPAVVHDHATLRISVENPVHQTYRPTLPARLLLDGVPSPGLGLRFGNGAVSPGWEALETGQRASIEREIGDLLEPGEHVIELPIGETRLRVTVRRAP